MDLTDRYLAAIRANLPKPQADDIIAELSANLAEERSDREAELGRPLTEDEVGEMIRAFGHPLVVAARYGRRQYVIGPEAYPFFVYALKTVFTIFGAVWLTLAVTNVIFAAGDPGQVITRAMSALWTGGLIALGSVTAVFILLERYAPSAISLRRWRPSSLPKMADARSSRWDEVSAVVAGVVFILWWTGVIYIPNAIGGREGFVVEPAAIWTQLYWPVLAAAALGVILHLVALLRPNWLTVRGGLNFVLAILGVVVFVALAGAGDLVDIVSTRLSAVEIARLDHSLDAVFRVSLWVTALIFMWDRLREGWRVWKARGRPC
jgi:hypothetical protein